MGKNAIALFYCSDGFNPFHHIISQGSYSIWAQSSLILNLPHQLRSKTGTTLLLGLISGPRAPKKLNKYNEVIVNELVQLKEGLATSCSHCTVDGIHSSMLDNTSYPGGRRFLDINNPLRQDTTFPSGATEDEVVIKRSTEDEKAEARYLDRLLLEKDSKGDITTAEDMQAAIMSGSGVYGCECAVVSVDNTKQTMFHHKRKGVNYISNLQFEKNTLFIGKHTT
ncbi:unnamed protein product [Mytilus edulis]|uniref:Uncharacterized protein n=1 Tax=Mytilus edulis TaxID=6550 RepID=A0A8S3QLG7_MYTED|nr:unnamed protein product [Mytilus edulis]